MRIETPVGPLYAKADGPADGPAVVLLHGFPEFWYGWRKQIPALAAAGFRVVAPDQRGYNNSAKPSHISAYALSELTADVLRVMDALGRQRVHVVGHDWGGIVAWAVAMQHPERVERLAILNAPHPGVARSWLTTSPRQMLRGWYIGMFQLPALPERLLSLRTLTATSKAGTFTTDELGRYEAAWDKPGARSGMIHWYRALARYARAEDMAALRVRVPTRIIWGALDPFLLRELASASLRLCDEGELVELPDATHWLHHEEPEVVNRLIIDHLCGTTAST